MSRNFGLQSRSSKRMDAAPRVAQVIRCDECDFVFEATDPRAFVSTRDSVGHALCPLCATLTLRSTEGWAVWNGCNGIFEVMSRRAAAKQLLADQFQNCDASVVPVRSIVEPNDGIRWWSRHHHEDESERRQG